MAKRIHDNTVRMTKKKKVDVQQKLKSHYIRQASTAKEVASMNRTSRNLHSRSLQILNDSDFSHKPWALLKHQNRATLNSPKCVETFNIVPKLEDKGHASVPSNVQKAEENLFVVTKTGCQLTVINAAVPTILLPLNNGKIMTISPGSKVQDLPCEGDVLKNIRYLFDKLAGLLSLHSGKNGDNA